MEDVDDDKKKIKTPVELTKKQELNNHIVLMRKTVRKARTHLINKLTKEIKKLKDRKGDDKAKEKAKRKAERLLEEVQVLKHLKEDKVSVFALQDQTTLDQVLQNPESSTEARALSRLGHHKLVQSDVLKYRTHNPHWILQIPVLLERSKEKRKKIDKKLAEREADLLRKKEGNSNNKLIQNKNIEEEKEEEKSESSESSENEAEEESESEQVQKVKKSPTLAKAFREKINENNKKRQLLNKQPQKNEKVATLKKPEFKIGKSEGTVKVQLLKDLTDLEHLDDDNKTEIKLDTKDITQVRKQKPKSSFFIGGVDEIREEAPGIKESSKRNFQKDKQQPTEFKPIFRKGKLVNKPAPRQFKSDNTSQQKPRRGNNNQRYFNNKDSGGDNSYSSNLTPLGNQHQKSKPEKNNSAGLTATTSTEKLHPSWEAKKRQQQQTLSEFKGKKIKFNDD